MIDWDFLILQIDQFLHQKDLVFVAKQWHRVLQPVFYHRYWQNCQWCAYPNPRFKRWKNVPFNEAYAQIPDSVTHFKMHIDDNDSVDWSQGGFTADRDNRVVPRIRQLERLQSLSLGDRFNRPLGNLSALTQLQSLSLGDGFNQPLGDLSALTQLRSLSLGFTSVSLSATYRLC